MPLPHHSVHRIPAVHRRDGSLVQVHLDPADRVGIDRACRSTFALPDLRGRVAIGAGTGPGLAPRILGETGGQQAVHLESEHLPYHTHNLHVSDCVV